MVKKSAATTRSQCCLSNSFQLVFRSRSGAGSIRCRANIFRDHPTTDFMTQIGQRSLDSPYRQLRFSARKLTLSRHCTAVVSAIHCDLCRSIFRALRGHSLPERLHSNLKCSADSVVA
jgi:hypothetical protein